MAMPFPPSFRSLDIEGQGQGAARRGRLRLRFQRPQRPVDEQRRAGLLRLAAVLATVLPAIDDEYATTYYTRVRDMVVLAAEIVALRGK
jgi:hypothetical protein